MEELVPAVDFVINVDFVHHIVRVKLIEFYNGFLYELRLELILNEVSTVSNGKKRKEGGAHHFEFAVKYALVVTPVYYGAANNWNQRFVFEIVFVEFLAHVIQKFFVLYFNKLWVLRKETLFEKDDGVLPFLANETLIRLGKLPLELVIFLEVPKASHVIVFNLLVEYEFRVIDLSCDDKWVDCAFIRSSDTFVDRTHVDCLMLFNYLRLLAHNDMVFIKLPLFIFA